MMLWIITVFSCACLIFTLLPFVPLAHGAFRAFDFPRIQISVLAALLLIACLLALPWVPVNWVVIAMLTAVLLIQSWHIARFSLLWRHHSVDFKGEKDDVPIVRLLVSNVKQSNREYRHLLSLVEKIQPDIAIFIETDQDWVNAIEEVTGDYSHRVEQVLDNGYGMLLVSRFRLLDSKVRFLLNQEVPSIDTMVDHPQGGRFRLFSLHPEPPLVHKDTMGRDAEIVFAGKLVRHEDLPVIVCGDLNDVAWSRTTRRFLRLSQLLDPREGRGLFNTFDARYFFLRWPLDHVFHSPHFQLVSMARMPFVNSDHFPMFYEFALTGHEPGRISIDTAEDSDLEEAAELIDIEKRRDRRPAGHDWEDEQP